MSRAVAWSPPPKPAPARRVYFLGDRYDAVIAESVEHAWEIWEETMCESRTDYDGDTWEAVPDDKQIEIGFEHDDDLRRTLREAEQNGLDLDGAVVSVKARGLVYLSGSTQDYDRRYTIRAPARWWAKMPAGFLCSEDW